MSLTACPEAYVELGRRLADAAASVTLAYFRTGIPVDAKEDDSPVTVADRQAERRLRELVEAHFPDHGFLGEELGTVRREAEFLWAVDPIDGTKSFITGSPMYGTLIALLQAGRPILGIIDMPALGERWLGALGRPTLFRDSRGERVAHARRCGRLEQAILRCTSPDMFRGSPRQFATFERLRQRVGMSVYGGDCYCYGQLASGYVDMVFEADLKSHDLMALVPVVEGAGGVASDWQGRPLSLDFSGEVLMCGDRRLHDQVLACIAG